MVCDDVMDRSRDSFAPTEEFLPQTPVELAACKLHFLGKRKPDDLDNQVHRQSFDFHRKSWWCMQEDHVKNMTALLELH